MEKDLVTCCGARLAISGMAPASLRTPAAERFLSGRRLDEEAVGQAVDLAARDIWSGADPGMTSGDRPSQIKALIHRAVRGALGRVRAAAT
jgi:CO/xanthine dehydrogenase FAD-binding subunit